MVRFTQRKGRVIAAHIDGPVEPRREDRRRSKDHVTNVRRKQREAKRALESLFV
ncbi:hypothetical protein [Paraburkholderia youngii]|uniref:Uncharacterized protein n=1 Tax=Paraburkholderia youngii TaxID=2782701 RepID=A0A7Y6MYB5_9BURK|nr:hypothetical protein [Paraburkholderia youngii]NUX98755.1 hypothetical protein [Paraburkholderia youngii]